MKTLNYISTAAIALLLFVINFGFMEITLNSQTKAAAFGLIFAVFGLNILLNYRNFTGYKHESLIVILLYVVVECILAGVYVYFSLNDTGTTRFKMQFANYAGITYGIYSFVVLSLNMPTIHRNIAELKGNKKDLKDDKESNTELKKLTAKSREEQIMELHKHGFTQQQIANKLNITQTTVSKYVRRNKKT